jgi:hypothetical protein
MSDEELEEVILAWSESAAEEGMIVTDLAAYEAWERAEYDRWCEERERRGEAA